MNDATRELGAALGVAVLGSIAASQYTSHLDDALDVIPASAREAASSSIAGALHAAEQLGGAAGRAFGLAAQTSFVDGLHVAAYFGVALCLVAAVLTTRYLPRVLVSRRRAELTGRGDGEHRGARSRRRAPGARRLARDELAHDGAGVPPGGA